MRCLVPRVYYRDMHLAILVHIHMWCVPARACCGGHAINSIHCAQVCTPIKLPIIGRTRLRCVDAHNCLRTRRCEMWLKQLWFGVSTLTGRMDGNAHERRDSGKPATDVQRLDAPPASSSSSMLWWRLMRFSRNGVVWCVWCCFIEHMDVWIVRCVCVCVSDVCVWF